MKKAEIMKQLHLNKTWNKLVTINGMHVGTILWHSKPWIVSSVDNWEDVTGDDKQNIIEEFKYQSELCDYIISNIA